MNKSIHSVALYGHETAYKVYNKRDVLLVISVINIQNPVLFGDHIIRVNCRIVCMVSISNSFVILLWRVWYTYQTVLTLLVRFSVKQYSNEHGMFPHID